MSYVRNQVGSSRLKALSFYLACAAVGVTVAVWVAYFGVALTNDVNHAKMLDAFLPVVAIAGAVAAVTVGRFTLTFARPPHGLPSVASDVRVALSI